MTTFRLSALMIFLLGGAVDLVQAQTCPPNNPPLVTPDSRYTVSQPVAGEFVVADTQTGLIWKQCPEGLSGAGCATGVISGLTWAAALGAANSATHAGFSDWRLPNIGELLSLVETSCFDPTINTVRFPAVESARYFWSASTFPGGGNGAWVVDFFTGALTAYTKINNFPTRLVRGGQALDTFAAEQDFTPNSFGFTGQTGVPLNSPRTSTTISISGLSTVVGIAVSGAASSTYSINGGAFVSAPGSVVNGDSVAVRHTSSGANQTSVTTTLTVGAISADFTSTTIAGELPPSLNFNPGVGTSIVYSSGGSAAPILVTPGGGTGSGAAATTTLGACTITGGAAFPVTSIAQLSFVGATTTPQDLVLPNCVRQPSAVNATLTCPESAGGAPAVNRVWTLTCPAAPAPVINAFAPSSATAIAASTITLTWNASNASSCSPNLGSPTIWPALGTLPTSGSFNLSAPASPGTLTFQLNCTNGGSPVSASVQVNVVSPPPPPAIQSFSPTQSSVVAGAPITLNWTSSNVASCSPALGGNSAWSGQGALPTNGSRSIAAPQVLATTAISFRLHCSNGAQVATATTVVTVAPGPAPTITSFFPSLAGVIAGTPITLNWSAANATACTPAQGGSTAWGALGTLPVSGTRTVTAPGTPTTITFQLDCGNGVQSASRTAQVVVQSAIVVPTVDLRLERALLPVCGFGSPTLHRTGVAWSSTDAAYCLASEVIPRTTFSQRACFGAGCPDPANPSRLRPLQPEDPVHVFEVAYSSITAGTSTMRLTCFNADGTASAFDEEALTTYNGGPFECQSVPSYTPSTTLTAPVPMPDGSVQVQSSVENPQGVPLSATILQQGQFGTATVEMAGDTVTVHYVADPGRFPEGTTATETLEVVIANGGTGVPVTYSFEVDLTLFADGFEGAP